MPDYQSVPRVKLRVCSCFSVSTGIKILSVIILAIWILFTFDTFLESSLLMFILSCVGCFYNLFLCFYVSITTTKLSSHFMRHPLQVVLASSIDVALSVVLVILAYSSPAVWEHGGTVAHLRVSNM